MTFNIEPLVGHKTGESFPSRHTVSAFAIAFALLNINIHLGIIALIIACIVGLSRIICAVHFISDVLCGFFNCIEHLFDITKFLFRYFFLLF